jgi:hypothetical protein
VEANKLLTRITLMMTFLLATAPMATAGHVSDVPDEVFAYCDTAESTGDRLWCRTVAFLFEDEKRVNPFAREQGNTTHTAGEDAARMGGGAIERNVKEAGPFAEAVVNVTVTGAMELANMTLGAVNHTGNVTLAYADESMALARSACRGFAPASGTVCPLAPESVSRLLP